jgi:single-strand DNA-binding protein
MAGETLITLIGNLTADPELRYTQNGVPVANFTIASTERTFDKQANEFKDGEAMFIRASAWRELAEHIAGSLTKGTRVVAHGKLKIRSYEKDGVTQRSTEIEIEEIGPSLRYATAQVTRAAGGGGGGQRQQGATPQQGAPQLPGQGFPQQGAPQGFPAQPQQFQQPQQGYPPQPQQGGFPDARTYQPQPGQPGQYGDDTPF